MGMIISHLMMPVGLRGEAFNGFPAALFAVLAGVSLSIMSSRGVRQGGAALSSSRHGLMVRGALLVVAHQLVVPFSGPIAVVLETFGFLYIALACVPRWSNRAVTVLLVWLVGLSALVSALSRITWVPGYLGSPYPLLAWATYMVIGLLAHRLLLRSTRVQVLAVAFGLPLAVAGAVMRHVVDMEAALSGSRNVLVALALIEPTSHSGGLIDLLATSAGALAVLSLCLLLVRGGRWWCLPLQAMGSMSLTVYVAHVLSAGPQLSEFSVRSMPILALTTILLSAAVAMLIRARFRHGPLEWALRRSVELGTSTSLPPRPVLGRV